MVAIANITKVLGGSSVLKRDVRSVAELEHMVEEGLPKASLEHTVSEVTDNRRDAIEVRNRIVPPATYKRRKRLLSSEESQRVERLARVVATALFVWSDRAAARQFLVTPHPLLEQRRPLDVAATDLGARRVEELLWGIVYGLPI